MNSYLARRTADAAFSTCARASAISGCESSAARTQASRSQRSEGPLIVDTFGSSSSGVVSGNPMTSLSCICRSERCKLGGQQLLPGLQRVGAALDQIGFERAAVSHLLDPLALQVFRRLDLREHRAAPDVGDQNPVIDLMDPQRRLVFDAARLSARGLRLGARDVVGGFHPEELCQRLNDAGSVGHRTHAALIENQRLRRNRSGTDDAEPAGRNFDQLRIRQVEQCRVVSHLRKVRALRHLLRVLLLLDRQLREADRMVVRQRQIDGFAKRDAPGRRRLGLLGECRARAGAKEQRRTSKTRSVMIGLSYAPAAGPSRAPPGRGNSTEIFGVSRSGSASRPTPRRGDETRR